MTKPLLLILALVLPLAAAACGREPDDAHAAGRGLYVGGGFGGH